MASCAPMVAVHSHWLAQPNNSNRSDVDPPGRPPSAFSAPVGGIHEHMHDPSHKRGFTSNPVPPRNHAGGGPVPAMMAGHQHGMQTHPNHGPNHEPRGILYHNGGCAHSVTSLHGPSKWTRHIQASMEGVLTGEQACDLLTANDFQPGPRRAIIQTDAQGIHQPLFKECPKRRLKGEQGADRWRNSGGEKGSSFLRNRQCVASRLPSPSMCLCCIARRLPLRIDRVPDCRAVFQWCAGHSTTVRDGISGIRIEAEIPRVQPSRAGSCD